jgi:hypothetical protein
MEGAENLTSRGSILAPSGPGQNILRGCAGKVNPFPIFQFISFSSSTLNNSTTKPRIISKIFHEMLPVK